MFSVNLNPLSLCTLLGIASNFSCPVVFLQKQVSSLGLFLAPLISFVRFSDEK